MIAVSQASSFEDNIPSVLIIWIFYCAQAALDLELDGFGHGHPERQAHDAARTAYLESRGILVKRFWNWQVRHMPQMVRDNLWQLLQERGGAQR